MILTTTQLQALKTYIVGQPDLNTFPQNSDGAFAVAGLLNVQDASYWVWRSTTSAADIADAVIWANLTPNDAPDGTAIYTNRVLICQAKQINLQILFQGQSYLATGKTNVRSGLSDALTNVPSGTLGALVDAGWLGAGHVKTAIERLATRIEKLFATGSGTNGVPSVLVYEGPISYQDVMNAWGS